MATVKVRALVIFKGNEDQRFLKPITDKTYGHCSVLLDTGLEPFEGIHLFNYVDSNFTSLMVQPIYIENFSEDMAHYFSYATSILSVDVEFPQDKKTRRGIQSCVSVSKHLLGINEWTVWTPKQLRELLINNYGATELLT